MFSGIDLSTVAFATELVIVRWRTDPRHLRARERRRRPLVRLEALAGTYRAAVHDHRGAHRPPGVSTFWAMPGLLALDAVGFLAGLAISPTLMTGYAILERQSPQHRTTEAMAWLSSTISVGVALAPRSPATSSTPTERDGALPLSACCGAAGVLICVAGLRRLRTEQDDLPAELGAELIPDLPGGHATMTGHSVNPGAPRISAARASAADPESPAAQLLAELGRDRDSEACRRMAMLARSRSGCRGDEGGRRWLPIRMTGSGHSFTLRPALKGAAALGALTAVRSVDAGCRTCHGGGCPLSVPTGRCTSMASLSPTWVISRSRPWPARPRQGRTEPVG
jgi:hypothetical protein